MAELSDLWRELLEGRSIVHLATLMPDGSPMSVAVWAGVEDGRPVFFTQAGSQKARNIDRDPRVALSIVDRANVYRTARLRGQVVERIKGEAALVIVDRISERYTGQPFPMRTVEV